MKKEPKLKSCVICGNEFKQFKSTQKVCSTPCAIEYAKQKEKEKAEREWRKEKRQRKEKANPEIRKKDLQKEINKLARKIDNYFGYNCIDCGKHYTGQIDAAHFKGVGANDTIRFNLHNIHSARANCNQYNKEQHHRDYPKGLEDRYGKDYLEMVQGLSLEYKHLGLTLYEIKEALKKTRKAIKEFDELIKGNLDGSMARAKFNLIIGIYE